MSIIEEARRRAAQKEGYNPALVGGAPRLRPAASRPPVSRLPVLPSVNLPAPGVSQGPVDAARLEAMRQLIQSLPAAQGGGTLPEPKGPSLASRAFSGLMSAVDAPRAIAMSGIGELGDAMQQLEDATGFNLNNRITNPLMFGGDGNASFGDITASGARFSEMTDLGALENPVTGFVGDVAFDPLTYVGVGAARGAVKGSIGDVALRQGSRRGLAETLASEAAAKGIAKEAIDPLIREAGQRGTGAFTRKGLERAGVSDDVLKQLGFDVDFGYSLGLGQGGRRVNIGGRRLAEMSANAKGELKKYLGNTAAARKFRQAFVGGSSGIAAAERQLVDNLLTGAPKAADSARGLALIKMASRDAHVWMDDEVSSIARQFGDAFKNLKPDQLSDITRQIEEALGEPLEGVAKQVADWFTATRQTLVDLGVEVNWLDDYTPHLMTDKARRLVMRDDLPILKQLGLDTKEAFQRTRTLKAGDNFLGRELQYGSIDEMNKIFREVTGKNFDLFESDVTTLMSKYLEMAMQARMKAQVGNMSGLVDMNYSGAKNLQDDLVQLETEIAESTAKIAKDRKKVINQAGKDAQVRQREIAADLKTVDDELTSLVSQVDELDSRLAAKQKELQDAEDALQMWGGVFDDAVSKGKRSAAAKKGAQTKNRKALEQKIESLRQEEAALRAQTASTKGRRSRQRIAELQEQRAGLRSQMSEAGEQIAGVEQARQAIDNAPVPTEPLAAEEYIRAAEKAQAARQEFVSAKNEYFDAASPLLWQLSDGNAQAARLSNRLDELEQVVQAKKGIGQAEVDEIADRARTVLEAYKQDVGPVGEAVRAVEAQALAHDISNGLKVTKWGNQADALHKALGDARFQEHMQVVLEDGLRVMNDKVAMPEWFAAAFEKVPRTRQQWAALDRALRAYDRAMNIWKGYATTSPGFVFRNAYSGYFNMYLDGVDPRNAGRMWRYLQQYHSSDTVFAKGASRALGQNTDDFGREAAAKWARSKGWTEADIARADAALGAASQSGWGLNPQEVQSKLVGAKKSWNPFDVEFRPTRYIRGASTNVEATMRVGHAYDVLKRADIEDSVWVAARQGDEAARQQVEAAINEATRHVEMFHFNYRDISDFDRAMKRVIPFWTFYSRNMALQAQVWTRWPQKLNRTYFNLKENLELSGDEDAVVPGYYEELGAIRIPGSRNNEGGSWYLTPDLPSLRFRQDLGQVTGTGDEGFDPLRMLSDTGPFIKAPVEMIANKELFTDIPYKNRLYDYTNDGEMTPRYAPKLLSGTIPFTDVDVPGLAPVMRNVLGQLPGAENVNGELVMTDKTQSFIEDMIPLLARSERLDPNTEKFKDRRAQSALSFIGAPLRENTGQAQRGEMFARQKRLEDEMRRERDRRIIEGLIP